MVEVEFILKPDTIDIVSRNTNIINISKLEYWSHLKAVLLKEKIVNTDIF